MKSDSQFLQELGGKLERQDNLATARPVWHVQERVRVYGIDESIHDPDGWEDVHDVDPVPYIEEWRLIEGAVFLTAERAGDWAASQQHNHPLGIRLYVGSLPRESELTEIRDRALARHIGIRLYVGSLPRESELTEIRDRALARHKEGPA